MIIYTRINGKLASFMVETDDHAEAIGAVRLELTRTRIPLTSAVLAVFNGGKSEVLEAA